NSIPKMSSALCGLGTLGNSDVRWGIPLSRKERCVGTLRSPTSHRWENALTFYPASMRCPMRQGLFVGSLAIIFGVGIGLPAARTAAPAADGGLKKIAESIDGYRWEFPCKDAMPENPKQGADCVSGLVTGDPKKTDNFSAEKTFGGDKG